MRLLKIDDNGRLDLTRDLLGDDEIPRYAILSHTWERDQEVTFDDFKKGTGNDKTGYKKIQFCAKQATHDGLCHFWVDTCCINKSDATELQHAINSMFRWYRGAAKCYVFLKDVSTAKRKADSDSFESAWESSFRMSRWFTRGWTLQELLAPRVVEFYSREGRLIGDLLELKQLVHDITGLPVRALEDSSLSDFGVEERLAWTKKRTTTREEDRAYSLLGIFDICMPLIYGEGHANAFRRLRKEIQERKYATLASLSFSQDEFNCLRSLSFPEQEHRFNDIHTAVATCEWLFDHPQYRDWAQGSQGLFWIKGNPGAGKSVLMKHARRTLGKQDPSELVASYFIHGQGSELQRTPLGVFRALLNSLLGHFPIHLAKLTAIFEDQEKRYGGYIAGRWSWSCGELQELLSTILVHGTQNCRVVILIDALDECGERPARDLLEYFNKLSIRVKESKANVKICVSSRHYPVLGLERFPAISVEEWNSEDIKWFVCDRLRDVRSTRRREQLQNEILSKAQGGFQWVFLITETLIDRNLAGKSLLGDITACPQSLSEMYATLLDGGCEAERCQMIKLFQWILFARRPLSAQELRDALVTDAKMDCTSLTELRLQESWSETLADFERYVKYISKGLVEFHSRDIWELYEPGGEDSDREAQLIHQSVADFLLEKYLVTTEQNGATAGHLQISRSCLKYLCLEDVLEKSHLQRGALSSAFPLAPYAVRYVFEHIKNVEQAGVDQIDLLSTIRWRPHSAHVQKLAELWKHLNPDNIGTPIGWPFAGSSEFHVLAALGSKSALITLLSNHNGAIDSKDASGNTPLHIAVREGHHDAALVLLDQSSEWHQHIDRDGEANTSSAEHSIPCEPRRVDINAENEDGDTALNIAVATRADTVVFRLIDAGAEPKYMGQEHMLVFHAISSKDMPLLTKLISKDIDLHGAVYFAIEFGLPQHVISTLLKAGADTAKALDFHRISTAEEDDSDSEDEDDMSGDDALHLACRKGLQEVVDLLLSNGASAISLNSTGQCPLSVAVKNGFGDIVQSLLRYEPSAVELPDRDGITALNAALDEGKLDLAVACLQLGEFSSPSSCLTDFFARLSTSNFAQHLWAVEGSKTAAERLLRSGCVCLTKGDGNTQSLMWNAAANGDKTLTELLLNTTGIGPDEKDEPGQTPMSAAAQNGHTDIAQSLVTAGARLLDLPDNYGKTPLVHAIKKGHVAMVQFLLATGRVDPDPDHQHRSPLIIAILCNQTAIVEVLLATGRLDLNRDNDWRASPLFLAIWWNRPNIVAQLLATGQVDINHKGGFYDFTPLLWAVDIGSSEMIKLLLAHPGIDPEIISYYGQTPLSLAVDLHRLDIVILLVDTGMVNINSDRLTKLPSLLWWATQHQDKTLFKKLLATGKADLEAKDEQGRTLLLWAAEIGMEMVVKSLLDTGTVNVNCTDIMGQTALWRAHLHGHHAVVQLLQARGALSTSDQALQPRFSSPVNVSGSASSNSASDVSGYTNNSPSSSSLALVRPIPVRPHLRPRRSMIDAFCPSFTYFK